jgi:aspartyl-tRNA(Asn)/glutamyl-tRNA(Gln) amidotransferase subunit B
VLPSERREELVKLYALSEYDAGVITADKASSVFFLGIIPIVGGKEHAKLAANWQTVELNARLNANSMDISESPVSPEQLGKLVKRIADGTISGKIAKEVFEAMWAGEYGGDADAIIEKKGLKQITDGSALEKAIAEVMAANPTQLADYRSGKDKLFAFFIGQVMKATKGKANPQQLNELLQKMLKS